MHIPPVAHHSWVDSCAYIQAQETLSATIDIDTDVTVTVTN
jgi:hypothetical protein